MTRARVARCQQREAGVIALFPLRTRQLQRVVSQGYRGHRGGREHETGYRRQHQCDEALEQQLPATWSRWNDRWGE